MVVPLLLWRIVVVCPFPPLEDDDWIPLPHLEVGRWLSLLLQSMLVLRQIGIEIFIYTESHISEGCVNREFIEVETMPIIKKFLYGKFPN